VAVEIAPPDAEGRARLFPLYGHGVGIDDLDDSELADAIAATEGRTATYLREVVRRAALQVAEDQAEGLIRVDGATLAEASCELLDDRAALTRALLGGAHEPDAEPSVFSSLFFTSCPPIGSMIHSVGGYRFPGGHEPAPPFAPDE
jgi:hypothetical protein